MAGRSWRGIRGIGSRPSGARRSLGSVVLAGAGTPAGHHVSSGSAGVAHGAAVHEATAPAPAHPNIVFVLTDDLSPNLLPYMPHVLALEQAGMSFSNYTVTDSLCCPSRASI